MSDSELSMHVEAIVTKAAATVGYLKTLAEEARKAGDEDYAKQLDLYAAEVSQFCEDIRAIMTAHLENLSIRMNELAEATRKKVAEILGYVARKNPILEEKAKEMTRRIDN